MTSQHEPQLRPLRAHERERLEQARVVLVRPRVGGVEKERLPLAAVRAEALVVDPVRDHAHAVGLDAEPLHERRLRVLGAGDHAAG